MSAEVLLLDAVDDAIISLATTEWWAHSPAYRP
jgi:hypothetical protein